MSNVFAKDRKESPMEVITIGREIYLNTYRLCMNEQIIPKKHRFMIAKSIINHESLTMSNTLSLLNLA